MSCKHGNHEAACELCGEEDRIYAMLDEERAKYLQCSGALNRALERIKVLEGALKLADSHLTLLYPGGIDGKDYICCTVRNALESK